LHFQTNHVFLKHIFETVIFSEIELDHFLCKSILLRFAAQVLQFENRHFRKLLGMTEEGLVGALEERKKKI
jgi:hypothetical protein